jgi:hypothetical protein
MTSSVVGTHWIGHPLLAHALAGPTSVKLYLKFEKWNPGSGMLEPVANQSVRVINSLTNVTVQAVQAPSAIPSDLEKTTDGDGQVSFDGEIPSVPSGGLTLHFVIGTLPGGWSTAGWNSRDKTVNGTILGYVGKILGTSTKPVIFLVGVPCWLTFRYERKCGEPVLFPLGTRIKLVTVNGSGGPIERANFQTGVTSDFKSVLYDVVPGEALRMLIFTRYERDPVADTSEFVLNPCDILTEYDFQYTEVGGSPPVQHAFQQASSKSVLKDGPPWIPSADTLSLCTWNEIASQIEALPVTITMPQSFQHDASFSSDESIQKGIILCTALHAATLIREFSGLISAILAGRAQWHGLNVDASGPETALTLTKDDGPETKPVDLSGSLRGQVLLPVKTFYDANAFSIGTTDLLQNDYRYLNLRNAVLHELGHCLMFSYSFDDPIDFSQTNDHFLNFFMDYDLVDSRQLPFWEGWAVYFSMLMLGPRDFLLSQMTRVAAKDPAMKGNKAKRDAALKAISDKSDADLMKAIENIFPHGNSFSDGIINSFAVGSRSGQPLANVLTAPELATAGVNVGLASEMCLAFSLYTLTRFLVERESVIFSGPAATDGLGRISPSGWYANAAVRDALWTAIFQPFLRLRGSSTRADTVERFTRFIRAATRNDPDWPTIKRIFNTYYLLIEAPRISSIQPGTVQAGSGQQTLTVTGRRFVARSSTLGDGGMNVELLSPSGVPVTGVTLAVDASTSLTVKAVFAVTGDYKLRLIGRWTDEVSQTVTAS